MTDILRCPRCHEPVQTRQTRDGATLTLNAHPSPVAEPATLVLLPDGTVLESTPGSFQAYHRHRCATWRDDDDR